MSIKYNMVKEIYFGEKNMRTSYGIVACDEQGDIDSIIKFIHDISADEQAVCDLVSRCNILQLSLEHFDDIVNDFINDVTR